MYGDATFKTGLSQYTGIDINSVIIDIVLTYHNIVNNFAPVSGWHKGTV